MERIVIPNKHGIELAESVVKHELKLKYKLIPFVPDRVIPSELSVNSYHAKCLIFVRAEIFVRSKSIHKALNHVFLEVIPKCEIILFNSKILANRYIFESKDSDIKDLIIVFVISSGDYDDAIDEFDADKFNTSVKNPEPHSPGWALGVGANP